MKGQKHTVRINPVITQSEFEHDMKDILKHGVIKAMAEYLGVSHTLLVQQFNPDDERTSWIFRALSVQIALDEIDPEAGRKLFDLFVTYRKKAMGKDEQQIKAEAWEQITERFGEINGSLVMINSCKEVQ